MAGLAGPFGGLGRLQATTLALRVSRAAASAVRVGSPPWRPPVSIAAVAARRRADLPAAERSRYDALLAGAADPRGRGVLERALAGGTPLPAIAALAGLWPELTDRDRDQVGAPLAPAGGGSDVRLSDAPARQSDQTTCGSTVLAMLAAAGDPLLALWLVTGRTVAGYRPRELRAFGPAELAEPDAAARFGAVQRAVKTATGRGSLGPFAWPARFGTPPWGAARVARYPGATFRQVMVDDTDAGELGALLDRADRALAVGVGVPLFTGGDLSSGPTTALPRHVVLLVPAASSGTYTLFEPAGGALHHLARAELLTPDGPRPALGSWSHVCWAILPEA